MKETKATIDDKMDITRDHDYFLSLWEQRSPAGVKHSADLWDQRAEQWAQKLATDGSFRRDLDDRVQETALYLRNRGLLGPETSVLDVGCGPGRFVTEFAKTAGQSSGFDLSPRMIEIAAAYAHSSGVHNTSFSAGDFQELDIEKQGLLGKYDLVFTSITPAIGTVNGLRKLMAMSRGYCFNSCCLYWEDELEDKLARDVFGTEQRTKPLWDRRWFYSLFNLLWLEGYYPETYYHLQETTDRVPVDEELALHYASLFFDRAQGLEQPATQVLDYLNTLTDADGMITQHLKRQYGWILWNVNKQTKF